MKFKKVMTLVAGLTACVYAYAADNSTVTSSSVSSSVSSVVSSVPSLPAVKSELSEGVLAKLAASPTYKHIKESGSVVMAVRETASPFSFNNGKDQFIGYAVELCEGVVKAMKNELGLPSLKVIYLPVTGGERIEMLEKGYADMECGSTTITGKRLNSANFSYAFFYSQSMFIGDKSKRLDRFDDLKGMRVAVAEGTIQESYIKDLNDKQNYGIKVLSYKNAQEAYLAALSHNADFVSSDDLLLLGMKQSIQDDKDSLKFFDLTFSPNTYGVILPKKDPAFTDIFNGHLKAIFDSKKAETIYSKWFLNQIPPKSSVLNWPIGKTKELFENPTSAAMLP